MNEPNTQKHDEIIDRAIRDASSIGRTWAAHGLTAGKAALETSAVTLRKVASFLGDLSDTIKKDEETIAPEAKAEAKSEPQAATEEPGTGSN